MNVLNELIQMSDDNRAVFAEAARQTTDSKLKAIFEKCSEDYAAALTELSELVRSLGGTPKDRGTTVGEADRSWAKGRAAIDDAGTVIPERMEHVGHAANVFYLKALGSKLPPQVHSTVQRQYYSAVLNLDFILDLRHPSVFE